MKRVLLDTNVLIDGVQDEHSAPWQIVQGIIDGELVGVISRPVKREYDRIIAREIKDNEYRQRLALFFDICEKVSVSRIEQVIEDDPEDDKILATGIQGKAEVIISSDNHLLTLDPYDGLRIMKPIEFVRHWKEETGSEWSKFSKMIGI